MKKIIKKYFLRHGTEEQFNIYWNMKRNAFFNTNAKKFIEILKESEYSEKEIIEMFKKDIDRSLYGEIMGA